MINPTAHNDDHGSSAHGNQFCFSYTANSSQICWNSNMSKIYIYIVFENHKRIIFKINNFEDKIDS